VSKKDVQHELLLYADHVASVTDLEVPYVWSTGMVVFLAGPSVPTVPKSRLPVRQYDVSPVRHSESRITRNRTESKQRLFSPFASKSPS
jgi:hypothetical protein